MRGPAATGRTAAAWACSRGLCRDLGWRHVQTATRRPRPMALVARRPAAVRGASTPACGMIVRRTGHGTGAMSGRTPRGENGTGAGGALVVLYDGTCRLCQASVRFIVRRDPAGRFRFAPLQGAAGAAWLDRRPGQPPDSVVLIEEGAVYTRSTAALRIARRLRFPWPLLYGLVLVPRPVRDAIYDGIARRRYAWFGWDDSCPLPPPDVRARHLADRDRAP